MERVVIIDDEILAVEYLKQLIDWEKNQCRVVGTACTAGCALALVKETLPDILFLDIEMPNMNGLDLVAHVREICPACTVVILTAYKDFSYAQKAVKLGVFDYLVKHELTEDKLIGVLKEIRKKREQGSFRENARKEKLLSAAYSGEEIHAPSDGLLGRGEMGRCLIIRENSIPYGREKKEVPIRKGLRDLTEKEFLKDVVMITVNDRERLVLLKFYEKVKIAQQDAILEYAMTMIREKYQEAGAVSPVFLISGLLRERGDIETFGKKTGALRNGILIGGISEILEREFGTAEDLYLRKWEAIREKVERFLYSAEKTEVICKKDLFEQIPEGWAILRNPEVIIMFWDYYYNFMESQEAADSFPFEGSGIERIRDIEKLFWQNTIRMRKVLDNRGTEKERKIRQAENYIRQNYGRDLHQAEIAEALGMSEGYLRNLFKREKGISLREYLQQVRIENAMRLLLKKEYKVYEVAELCGFTTAQYFSMVFQSMTGMTPTEYANGAGRDDKKQF